VQIANDLLSIDYFLLFCAGGLLHL